MNLFKQWFGKREMVLPHVKVNPTGMLIANVARSAAGKSPSVKSFKLPDGKQWGEISAGFSFNIKQADGQPVQVYVQLFSDDESKAEAAAEHVVLTTSTHDEALAIADYLTSTVWDFLSQDSSSAELPVRLASQDHAFANGRPGQPSGRKFPLWLTGSILILVTVAATVLGTQAWNSRKGPSMDLTGLSIQDIASIDSSPDMQRKLQMDFSKAIEQGAAAGKDAAKKIQEDQLATMKSLGLNPGISAENALGCLAQKQ